MNCMPFNIHSYLGRAIDCLQIRKSYKVHCPQTNMPQFSLKIESNERYMALGTNQYSTEENSNRAAYQDIFRSNINNNNKNSLLTPYVGKNRSLTSFFRKSGELKKVVRLRFHCQSRNIPPLLVQFSSNCIKKSKSEGE